MDVQWNRWTPSDISEPTYPTYREIDVSGIITKFLKVAGFTNRIVAQSNARRETKLKIYNTFAISILKYGCKVWALKKKDKGRITAAEMQFTRRSAGYTLLNKKKNADIMNELRATSIIVKIRNYRRRWNEHINRIEEERSPKRISAYKLIGKRSRGRPKRKLVDTSDFS